MKIQEVVDKLLHPAEMDDSAVKQGGLKAFRKVIEPEGDSSW